MKGYIVRLSDGSYFSAISRNKRTKELAEATVFPHREHEQITSPGWNISMYIIEEAKDKFPELVEVEYELTISQTTPTP